MNRKHSRDLVVDFGNQEFEQADDGDPEPAGPEDFYRLRNAASQILHLVGASTDNKDEHIVPVGQNLHLHLFAGSDGFGVYSQDPNEAGGLALRAPLVTRSKLYLRVPRSIHDNGEGYIAGLPHNKVSRRSVNHILGLCTEYINAHGLSKDLLFNSAHERAVI